MNDLTDAPGATVGGGYVGLNFPRESNSTAGSWRRPLPDAGTACIAQREDYWAKIVGSLIKDDNQ